MPYVNNDSDKSFASSGVGTAALTTGIIGTALGSGILNGGLSGLFGGNQNPTASPVYQLAQKDTEIAQLRAQQYSDNRSSPSPRRWRASRPRSSPSRPRPRSATRSSPTAS